MVPENWTPQWLGGGIHSGHAPSNFPYQWGVAPDLYWKHLAYVTDEQRQAKYEQYMQVRDQLTPDQLAHAESILD
jgi:hypothetical protein